MWWDWCRGCTLGLPHAEGSQGVVATETVKQGGNRVGCPEPQEERPRCSMTQDTRWREGGK